MVEVSIALLVVAVALTAVFGLIPSGLQASRKAVSDTRQALFAEEALNGYLAVAQVRPWNSFENYAGLDPAAAVLWDNPESIKPNAGRQSLSYVDARTEIEVSSVRYDLRIQTHPDTPDGRIKYVRLDVAAGAYGPLTDTMVFYTELFNTGVTNNVSS
jgi:hypothetical protein